MSHNRRQRISIKLLVKRDIYQKNSVIYAPPPLRQGLKRTRAGQKKSDTKDEGKDPTQDYMN